MVCSMWEYCSQCLGVHPNGLGKLAQSGEQWQSLMTTLMLSLLQWEVSQAQWSDLCGGDYVFGFGYRGSNWSMLAISLMLVLGNATN